jgi:serine/threonine protein kinase/Flp pilus assembly protein TadD
MTQPGTPTGPAREESSQGAGRSFSFAEARSLKRELLEELRRGGAGGPVRPEDLLSRWPDDPKDDPDVASLLFADYCARLRQGEQASTCDYDRRFPEHRDSLASLLRQHGVLRSLGGVSGSGVTLRLPDVGEELFGFRLRYELGRGAFARVFLAEQGGLADRPVVLKISGIEGDEPRTLAQLQHTHIVPIYSVHEDAAAGLRAVCMPYFGGASLSRVLEALWQAVAKPERGQEFVDALRAVQAPAWGHRQGEPDAEAGGVACFRGPSESPNPEQGREGPRKHGTQPGGPNSVLGTQPAGAAEAPALESLGKASYVHAVAWVVARLADALQHAHQRGIQHRDIKPSNVLIGADGQPMLLDFNLAQDLGRGPAEAAFGGTVAYMAPEHLRALAARDPALARLVEHRADIYSLGMVLYEMLAGQSPFDQSASYSPLPMLIEAMALERGRTVPSLRRHRPDVPWGLESIARKCLDPDAGRRYQQAGHLAEDLRCFLEDRPLRHAPELSTAERLAKWARRHPTLTSSASVATAAVVLLAAVGIGAAAAVTGVRRHLAAAQEELAETHARDSRRAYEEGTQRALCLVNATTSTGPENTRRGLAVCEQTLGVYGVLRRPDWEQHPDWQRLPTEDRRRLADDTRELLLLLAWARVQAVPTSSEVLKDALALLDRAEAVQGLEPSPALAWARADYLDRLGDAAAAERAREEARRRKPASARDHYLLAVSYVRNSANEPGAHARAVAELEEAVRLNARHYWSWMQKGLCHEELGHHAAAAADFGVCVGLWPEFAWGYFNRGHALAQDGRPAEAVEDYTAALARDPDFALAYLNRGSTRLVLRQYEAALADFTRLAELADDDATRLTAHTGRGEALEALGRPDEANRAFAAAFGPSRRVDEEVRVRALLQYGFAVHARLPGKAREAFAEVLRGRPDQPQALHGQAMVLENQDRPEEAVQLYTRALQADPGLLEAQRRRGIVLARLGRFDEAERDINWCLEREKSGPVYYAAACVSALLAEAWTRQGGKTSAEVEAATNQGLTYLQWALANGYGRDTAATDRDLEGIRKDPRFEQLLREK